MTWLALSSGGVPARCISDDCRMLMGGNDIQLSCCNMGTIGSTCSNDVYDDVSNLFRNIIAMESYNESSDEEKLFIKVLEDRMQNLMEEKNQTFLEAVEIRMQEILDEKSQKHKLLKKISLSSNL